MIGLKPEFPADVDSILSRVDSIDPLQYASTRNFLNGAVTGLSPYISRGVISTRWVVKQLLKKGCSVDHMQKLLQELCWRDYFQRVQQHFPTLHEQAIRQDQEAVVHRELPATLLTANTGIRVIDEGINLLYESGYMHNHLRMYTAMLSCNIVQAHWRVPAKWMYYHLLDADVASNYCSWQWVAGAFSSKKYFANQENIDRYSHSVQPDTFLSVSYEEFPLKDIPSSLREVISPDLSTVLPSPTSLKLDESLPVRIYTSYNLDPFWRNSEQANNILLLEPTHFRKFPISQKVLEFILKLSENIAGIQLFIGEFSDLKQLTGRAEIIFKEHPLFSHLIGTCDQRDWIFPELDRFYPSFFGYWKKAERRISEGKWMEEIIGEEC